MASRENFFPEMLVLSVFSSVFLFNKNNISKLKVWVWNSPGAPHWITYFCVFMKQFGLATGPPTPNFKPVFYRRYVDDTFILFRDQAHILDFFTYMNSQHPNISFTYEIESENKLSMLDVTVEKEHNTFSTSVFVQAPSPNLALAA